MKAIAAAGTFTLVVVLGCWAWGYEWVADFEAQMVEHVEDGGDRP